MPRQNGKQRRHCVIGAKSRTASKGNFPAMLGWIAKLGLVASNVYPSGFGTNMVCWMGTLVPHCVAKTMHEGLPVSTIWPVGVSLPVSRLTRKATMV